MQIISKEQAQATLKRIGDFIDGTQDGHFSATDLAQRVNKELGVLEAIPGQLEASYDNFKTEAQAHPMVAAWKGFCAGAVVGMAVLAPIAYGVARAVLRGLGFQ